VMRRRTECSENQQRSSKQSAPENHDFFPMRKW